jgi:FkbM family methyltransferase
MITYSQTFEDVLLDRCFGRQQTGFYVDIGAWHPLHDSVTLHFYDRGWRGINVEPELAMCNLLRRFRPRDVNLAVALSDKAGEAEFYLLFQSGLSTLESSIAARAEDQGIMSTKMIIPIMTLAEVCAKHAPAMIDFLKIDVEGAERKVISGNDWNKYRPRVVLVEATLPNSQEPSWHDWEHLLEAARYQFVYFDGLNRFYVAEEELDALTAHFRLPVSIFDQPIRFSESLARDRVNRGPLTQWRDRYFALLEQYALEKGEEFDKALYAKAWDPAKVGQPATMEDIDKSYRLILGREPDRPGRDNWSDELARHNLLVREVIERTVRSVEFLRKRVRAAR